MREEEEKQATHCPYCTTEGAVIKVGVTDDDSKYNVYFCNECETHFIIFRVKKPIKVVIE